MQATYAPSPLGGKPTGTGSLLGAALRRPGGRRALSAVSLVLVLAGVGLFAYPAVTDVIARQRQHRLTTAIQDPGYAERYKLREIKVGDALTRLIVPRLKIDVLVVEGTTPAALKAGAGHYRGTPLPGEAGNVGIAGHRTTYGRPFNKLDTMTAGDVAYLVTPFATYTYTVQPAFDGHANPWPVSPTDVDVVSQVGADHWLTLTTCHPKGSARQRLVLRLWLTHTDPPLKAGETKPKSAP